MNKMSDSAVGDVIMLMTLWWLLISDVDGRIIMLATFFVMLMICQWLDSDLIPRLLENFENWKNFMVILLSVKNDAYRRIFGA